MESIKSGSRSRTKGRRGEQQLVLHLSKLGYKAERILRQYAFSGQPDVVAEKRDERITFELKLRRKGYRSFYALFDEFQEDGKALFCVTSGLFTTGVAMAKDFTLFKTLANEHMTYFRHIDPTSPHYKICNRIVKLKELKQNADYLVLREDRFPMLFIKYW